MLVVVTVPNKVVVVGSGHPRTDEQNLDADAVLLMTDVIEEAQALTLDTVVQEEGAATAKVNN